jgi:hypothetical protein
VTRSLPRGDRGCRSGDPSRASGPGRAVPGPRGLVWRIAVDRGRKTATHGLIGIKHGGFARFGRETPCASEMNTTERNGPYPVIAIDSYGKLAVCLSCHRLGPHTTTVGVFVCEVCAQAAAAYVRALAESVPELRDHRLKRRRLGCDCQRCQRRRDTV